MKKRVLTIVAALAMAITPAMAQVFIDDNEWNDNRVQREDGDLGVMVLTQDSNLDQYTPVGEGLFLFGGLGVAYLLGKRKKDE